MTRSVRGLHRFLRAAVIALVLALVGPASSASIPQPPAAMGNYAYNSHHHSAFSGVPASERGPPARYDRHANDYTVDRRSDGASARPDGLTPSRATTYDDAALLVHIAPTSSTTWMGADGNAGELPPLERSDTAANTKTRGLFDVRSPNSAHPPNADVVSAMRGSYHPCYDCSEIAQDLLIAAGGQGKILTYTPEKGMLRTPESGGRSIQDFVYHSVYTDGGYAYDPRFSSTPVPIGDFNRMMRGLNPGVNVR